MDLKDYFKEFLNYKFSENDISFNCLINLSDIIKLSMIPTDLMIEYDKYNIYHLYAFMEYCVLYDNITSNLYPLIIKLLKKFNIIDINKFRKNLITDDKIVKDLMCESFKQLKHHII